MNAADFAKVEADNQQQRFCEKAREDRFSQFVTWSLSQAEEQILPNGVGRDADMVFLRRRVGYRLSTN